jgi:hypothetical protein
VSHPHLRQLWRGGERGREGGREGARGGRGKGGGVRGNLWQKLLDRCSGEQRLQVRLRPASSSDKAYDEAIRGAGTHCPHPRHLERGGGWEGGGRKRERRGAVCVAATLVCMWGEGKRVC